LIAQFVNALEKNNIGWAFWPYKKWKNRPRSSHHSARRLAGDR